MPTDWAQLAKDLTLTSALALAVLAYTRSWIVPKITYDEMKAQMQTTIDDLKEERDSAVRTMRESIAAFDKAVDILRHGHPDP